MPKPAQHLPDANPPFRHPGGFTLIELLTVIAIIGILAAIIIPTVARVRNSARTAACLSNLRQIALAGQMYANDNKMNLVPICRGTGATDAGTWRIPLAPYLGLDENKLGAGGVLTCPGDLATFGPYTSANEQGFRPASYGINKTIGIHEYLGSVKGQKFTDVKRPSQTIFICDITNAGNTTAAPSAWTDRRANAEVKSYGYAYFPGDSHFDGSDAWDVFPRHSGKANVAFYDGRAKTLDVQKDLVEKQAGDPGCLFMNN
ncbi:prepilin-type N-terminal cleavage/methylation domain-containing protein [Opitutaceae bacterium TAV1]|nr:prepilin-type N-terminal cleavage/methylation domain-containing protein [Opitutaceae bacterium TAV1]